MKHTTPFYFRLLACAITLIPHTCLANSSNVNTLEEIVISADFREKQLMQIPSSVSVITDTAIRERAAEHLEQLINSAPNINFTSAGSRAKFIQIRGVGDLEQFTDPKHFPSVGIAIDGITLGGIASNSLLLDTQQVEILRGPQGTRFGSSGLAGMINITSNDPSEEFEGRAEAGVGNYNSWRSALITSGSLGGDFSGRVALQKSRSDGYIENQALNRNDTNQTNETSGRAKLRWNPNDQLRIDLNTLHVTMANGYDTWSLDNTRTTYSDQPGEDAQRFTALSLNSQWVFSEQTTIEAILSQSKTSQDYSYDEDWSYTNICVDFSCPWNDNYTAFDLLERDRDETSADIRLLQNHDNFRTVIGLFTQNRDESLERKKTFTSVYKTQRKAIYGEISTDFNQLSVTVGLRHERFDDEYADSNAYQSTSYEKLNSGELNIKYHFENSLIYTTISRGAKPGGVNTNASSSYLSMAPLFQSAMNNKQRFDGERVLNKELGYKASYLEGSLQVRSALFHMDRKNAQLEAWMWDATNFLWIGYIDSSSDAENYGLEIETDYQVNQAIQLFANLGWLKTKVDSLRVFDLDDSAFKTINDREQAKAPRYQFNVGTRLQLTENLSSRIEVEGRDESYYGYYHNGKLDNYSLLHASLNWQKNNIELQLWGRNLTNKQYAVHGLYFGNDPRKGWPNETYKQYGEPRSFGVNASYTF